MTDRLAVWSALAGERHWWARNHAYLPPVFALLTDDEWALMEEWWATTDAGEVNVPGVGVLQGFVEGGGIRRIVELGRFEGYSTLLMGFMLRRMGARNGLISFDVLPLKHDWIGQAGLGEYVRIVVGDSRNPASVAATFAYFGQAPDLVFLDTLHTRGQAAVELPLWYAALAPGGLLILHDSTEYAAQWDATGEGGVHAGLHEWLGSLASPPQFVNLNDAGTGAYGDANGLAIIAKPA